MATSNQDVERTQTIVMQSHDCSLYCVNGLTLHTLATIVGSKACKVDLCTAKSINQAKS